MRAYNDAVGSYEARVLPAARRFEDHGSVAAGRELPEMEPVTVSARSVHAPELVAGELVAGEPHRRDDVHEQRRCGGCARPSRVAVRVGC